MGSKAKSLADHLVAVPDPRKIRDQRHVLLDIIIIAILGTLSSVDDWEGIEEFAKDQEAWLRTFLELGLGWRGTVQCSSSTTHDAAWARYRCSWKDTSTRSFFSLPSRVALLATVFPAPSPCTVIMPDKTPSLFKAFAMNSAR